MALERFLSGTGARWWSGWILRGYFCLFFWKINSVFFHFYTEPAQWMLHSDHNRIWLGSWLKLCPLYNYQVRDLHVKGLQFFLLNRSRKALHHPSQRSPFFYSRSLWGLPKTKFTSSYAHLATPGAAATCSASLLERQQQKSNNLSYACNRKEFSLCIFEYILTVSVEKIKAEYYNISTTFYKRKKN